MEISVVWYLRQDEHTLCGNRNEYFSVYLYNFCKTWEITKYRSVSVIVYLNRKPLLWKISLKPTHFQTSLYLKQNNIYV